jgi:hypothetical protein
MLGLAMMLVGAACSAPPTGQQRLNSAMVGSDVVLPRQDTRAVSEIGLELVALAAPLEVWWSGLDDPGVPWLARAPELLDEMSEGVDRIDGRLAPGIHRAVRETFAPYVARWRQLLAALEDLRIAVADADRPARDAAVLRYDRERAAIRRLDEERVARVIAAFGPDEAGRLLREEGVDPGRFGLGR